MTREEKYAQWLVDNQDKQGTPEFDTVASAYRQLRSGVQAAPAPAPQDDRGSMLDLAAQGATLGFSDELAGLYGGAMNALRLKSPIEGYRGTRDIARERVQAFRERNPGAALAAEFGGGLLTGGVGAGRALAGAGLRELAKRGAATGAGLGAAQGLGYSEGEGVGGTLADIATGAGIGGIFGGAGSAVGGRLAAGQQRRRAQDAASDVYQRQVKVLEDAGIPLTGGQKSGINYVKTAEGTLADVPFTGAPLQRAKEGQQRAYQKKLFDLIGVKDIPDDGMLTKQALDETAEQLSDQYTKSLGNKTIDITDDAFLDGLEEFQKKFKRFAGDELTNPANKITQDLLDEAASGPITGETYQSIRSQFARRSRGTSPTAEVYEEAKKLLDDAFARAVGPEVKGNLDARYAQYKQLRNYFDQVRGGSAGAEGYISPTQIAGIAGKNPGTKEWREFTRSAASVLPERLGKSGTAERNAILRALENPMVAVGSLGLLNPNFAAGALLGRGASSQLAKGRYPDIEGLLTPNFRSLAPGSIAAGTGVTAGILGGQ